MPLDVTGGKRESSSIMVELMASGTGRTLAVLLGLFAAYGCATSPGVATSASSLHERQPQVFPIVYEYRKEDFETNPPVANTLRAFVANASAKREHASDQYFEVFIIPEEPVNYQRPADLQVLGANLDAFVDFCSIDAKGKKNYLQPPGNIPIAEITQGLLTLAGRLNVKTAKVIINSSLQRR